MNPVVITIENVKYTLERNYKDAWNESDFKNRYTNYFKDYDYIFGDYSQEQLRLKGFCDKTNKKANKINHIERLEEYIKNFCPHECRYFLIKKQINS